VGVLVGALGGFEVLSVAVDGGRRTAGAFPLPRRAVRTSRGLRLASPAAHPLSGSGGDGACFATTPEAHGRRLRVLRLCAGREEPEELWMLLPGAETVTVASFLDLGEGPVLAVLTRTRLGLFVKQDLRVFALEVGRTRVGNAPLLAARTGCPLWRDVELGAVDADGDGRRDLTITCTQGLADQELRLEVFRGLGGGGLRLEGRARTATVDGSFASWTHGADLTGDGLPDLLAWRDGGGLELYAGRRRGRPLEGRPAAVHAVPGKPGDEEVRIEVEVGSEGGEVRRLAAGRRLLVGRAPDGAPAAFVLRDVEVRAPGAPSAGRMALGVVPLR
jgi:hypothetical protein